VKALRKNLVRNREEASVPRAEQGEGRPNPLRNAEDLSARVRMHEVARMRLALSELNSSFNV